MTRSVVSGSSGGAAAVTGTNMFSGTFGGGNVMTYGVTGTFTIPAEVTSLRVRLWGGGGGGADTDSQTGGGGGGFAIKTLTVTPGAVFAVTVGAGGARNSSGGTSSFGSDVSATGGGGAGDTTVGNHNGGTGVGGDINATGGFGDVAHRVPNAGSGYSGGGGAGSLLGDGNDGLMINGSYPYLAITRGGGGGGLGRQGNVTSATWAQGYGTFGKAGFNTGGGVTAVNGFSSGVTSILSHPIISIDMIGTGPGGWHGNPGHNGGGGSGPCHDSGGATGGFPGGGGGSQTNAQQMPTGASGLVILEY